MPEPGRKLLSFLRRSRREELQEKKITFDQHLDRTLTEVGLSGELKEAAIDVVLSMPPPVFQTIYNQMSEYGWASSQRYSRYREMLKTDGELWGVTNDFASLVQHAFNAIVIRPGYERDEMEEKVLEMAKEFGEAIDIEDYFYANAFNLLRDGDIVIGIDRTKDPWELVPLPMEFVTAVDSLGQIGVRGVSVSRPQYIILDELNMMQSIDEVKLSRHRFKMDDIMHIPWCNKGTVVEDNMGRITYNVWSQSPLQAIKKTFEWKQHITDIDILWRSRMPPRMHHQLDMEAYAPEKFKGTREQQITASRSAAQAVIDEYAVGVEYKKADQDYITGAHVNIAVVEANSTNYHAPNEMFEYFIMVYCAITGVPKAAFQGESGGSFAADLIISNYAAMRAEIIARKIAKAFTKLIRDYLTWKWGQNPRAFPKKNIEKIEVQVSLMFNKDFRELGRFISLLAGTGAVTQDELREYLGKLPLTAEEKKRILYIGQGGPVIPGADLPEPVAPGGPGRAGDHGRTAGDSAAAAKQGSGTSRYPETPHSEGKGQDT
jgi:hypothetical protein